MSFKDKWNKTQPENMAVKILESIKSQPPLKPRIEEAQKKLELQISKLDGISTKIVEKDQVIFKRIVHSIQNHDVQYAKLLSNELSQIRKMSKMVDSAKLHRLDHGVRPFIAGIFAPAGIMGNCVCHQRSSPCKDYLLKV